MLKVIFAINDATLMYQQDAAGLFGPVTTYWWGLKDAREVTGPFDTVSAALKGYQAQVSAPPPPQNVVYVNFHTKKRSPPPRMG